MARLRDSLLELPDELTFSGGVAEWRLEESLPELLARGDAAMYRAKRAGRNRILLG